MRMNKTFSAQDSTFIFRSVPCVTTPSAQRETKSTGANKTHHTADIQLHLNFPNFDLKTEEGVKNIVPRL